MRPDLDLVAALGGPPTLALSAYIAAVFVAGGLVKGLLGVGTPLVAVPLLALVLPGPKAIALLVAPALSSNVWQAIDGGHVLGALRRFAPLIVTLLLATALSARVMIALPVRLLDAVVAISVLLSVVLMWRPPKLTITSASERYWSAFVGTLSGIMGGASSLMGPLVIVYLLTLKLPREEFVGTISVIYLAGALPLYGVMMLYGVIGMPELVVSVLTIAPMFAGMAIGKRLRHRVSEAAFRRSLLIFLTVVALTLVAKSLRWGSGAPECQ